MEGIHGVDVSWLHHSPKGHILQRSKSLPDSTPAEQNGQQAKEADAANEPKTNPDPHKTNGSTTTTPQQTPTIPRRSSLLHRSSYDKNDSSPPTATAKASKDQKPSTGGRRSSWVTSLSSKFSSGSNANTSSKKSAEPAQPAKQPNSPFKDNFNPFDSADATPKAEEETKADNPPYIMTPPESPSKAHGFLHNAMRRLSSSGPPTGLSKLPNHGGICPRKTLNIDPYRERCTVPELEQKKLRRVAFCVDVEIAGSAQYGQDEAKPNTASKLSIHDEAPLIAQEKKIEAEKKLNETQTKRSEGEALKSPAPEAQVTAKELESESTSVPEANESVAEKPADVPKEAKKKKDKKKKSEEGRKHRKENRHRDALANGKIPAEIHKEDGVSSSGTSTPDPSRSPAKAQDKPTTDPLRIYRRCCQLRETIVVKKIVEQISSPTSCPADSPGVISVLDLSNTLMQLQDIVTLGDYLSVVPVKRLYMENCGLGNEAVRILLSGLLAAKSPEQSRFNRRLKKKPVEKSKGAMEQTGVVEKVNFKNNPNIGKEGWKHIALFINLSRSLKAIDLSMIPFPRAEAPANGDGPSSGDAAKAPASMINIFHEAVTTRLAGDHFEELVMSSCSLETESIGRIVDAVLACKVTRLGLASNNITREGFQHVLRFLKGDSGHGLDIGGNNIRDYVQHLANAIDEKSPLWAISLADCGLDPPSLDIILPALVKLTNFRFVDLSHNRDLFSVKPSCINSLRKWLPQFPILKRLHLSDVAMTPEHAIALADILPECKRLAHISILENHLLSPLANAQTEESQEEACALYASYMAAVRVSDTLIAVDLDVPGPDSSEIVKALAKQVVAYSLRNLEALPLQENAESIVAAMNDSHKSDQEIAVPEVLLHLVGHVEGSTENHDDDPPAPDNDYIVGGTGLVKALDICLKRGLDGRGGSVRESPSGTGTATPQTSLQSSEVTKGKAKEMSKNLLGSARKIRERLRPALINEAKEGTDMNFRRLQFLDQTLERIILRFETEFPECRPSPPSPLPSPQETDESLALRPAPFPHLPSDPNAPSSAFDPSPNANSATTPTNTDTLPAPQSLSRQSSSRSLTASKLQAQEEGRMHRLGLRLRREILKRDSPTATPPNGQDHSRHQPSSPSSPSNSNDPLPHFLDEDDPNLTPLDRDLRARLDKFDGQQIQDGIREKGVEAVLEAMGATERDLQVLEGEEGREGEVRERRRIRGLVERIWREEWGE